MLDGMSTLEGVAPTRTTRLGDLALTLAVTVVGVVGTVVNDRHTASDIELDAFGLGLVLTTALALLVRRRRPIPVLAVATVSTTIYLALGYVYGPILFAFVISVYTVARHVPLRRALPYSLGALALLLTHLLTNDHALPGLTGLLPISAWVLVPFAVGLTVRSARENAARTKAETIRQHVDTERLRVAQEVHDIVGHGLAAIKMQADVALHVLAKRPEQAETALEAISRTSSAALEELRATLATVRTTAEEATAPAPSLARLPELTERMAEAGVRVRVETAGRARPLPAIVDLTAYRIVQESLTNVLRHSGAAEADVRLRYEAAAVRIVITNPVVRASDGGGGLGIPGMRERVLALGGEFEAGPASDGAFRVEARLPIGASGATS
jgi:signal transduction histidine kinase